MYLINMILFIVCISYKKRTIKSLDKLKLSVFFSGEFCGRIISFSFICGTNNRKCQAAVQRWFMFGHKPQLWQEAKHLHSFIWLVKSTFPKSLEDSVHCFHIIQSLTTFEVFTSLLSWAPPYQSNVWDSAAFTASHTKSAASVFFNLQWKVKVHPQQSASWSSSGSSEAGLKSKLLGKA